MVLLAGVLFFTQEDEGKQKKEVRPHLITSAIDDIGWIEISRPGSDTLTFSLDSSDGVQPLWQMTTPVKATADQEKVKSLLDIATKLVGIPVSKGNGNGVDMSQYSLDTASAINLKVGRSDGSILDEVHLGKILPLDVGYIYATMPKEDGNLYKAQKQIKDALEEDDNAYRGHKILYQEPDSVTDIVIERNGEDNLHLNKAGEWWNIVSPGKAPADDEKISEMIKAFGTATIKDFSDQPLNRINIDNSRMVTLKLNGPNAEETIVLPYPAENNPGEAGTSHDPDVVSLDKYQGSTLIVTRDDLVHRGLLRFIPGDIQDVVITNGGITTEIEKTDENQWQITSPVSEKAEPALVFRIFSVLVRYRLPNDAYLLSNYRLPENSKEETSFRLVEKSGTEHIIKVYPYEKKAGKVLVTSTFLNSPVLLDTEILENIPLGADDFVDKKLLHINPMALGAIEIERSAGENIRLEKFANEWVVTKPERVSANTPIVWGLIFGLEKSEFIYKLDSQPAELPENSILVKLWGEDKEEEGSIEYYIPDAGMQVQYLQSPDDIIVTSSALKGYYAASADILKELPESYRDILYRD